MHTHRDAALTAHVTHDQRAMLAAERGVGVGVFPLEHVKIERAITSGDSGAGLVLEPKITLV
jgi:hypothetical protein